MLQLRGLWIFNAAYSGNEGQVLLTGDFKEASVLKGIPPAGSRVERKGYALLKSSLMTLAAPEWLVHSWGCLLALPAFALGFWRKPYYLSETDIREGEGTTAQIL